MKEQSLDPELSSPSSGAEKPPRRRYPRYAVAALAGRLRRPLPARLMSWGVDGVDLETHHHLPPGQTLYFRFREGPDQWVVIDGRVAWCRPAADSLYRAGIELRAGSPRMARELLAAFRSLAPDGPDGWQLDGDGRYCSEAPVLVMYELEYDLEVRSLSRGGLLMDAPTETPELDARVELEIPLPDGLLRSKARVAYLEEPDRSDEDRPGRVGVAFVELRQEDEHGLRSYLSELAPTSPEDA